MIQNASRRGTSVQITIENRDTGEAYPWPKGGHVTSEATRRVGGLLRTETRMGHELWESCPQGTAEEFEEHAARLLSDRTDVSGQDLRAADWRTLWSTLCDVENDEKGEKMAEKKTKETAAQRNKRLREEIAANIERVRSLAEAENIESTQKLSEETDALIAQLPARERNKLRQQLNEAGQAREKLPEKRKAEAPATLATQDFAAEVEDGEALMLRGRDLVVQAMRHSDEGASITKQAAEVLLDIRIKARDKDGNPDLALRAPGSRNAAMAVYDNAVKVVAKSTDWERFKLDKERSKVKRSVRYHLQNLMADYLKALAHDTEEAAAERERYKNILKDAAQEDVPKVLAEHYKVSLVAPLEKEKAKYHAALESGDRAKAQEIVQGSAAEEAGEDPDAMLRTTVKELKKSVKHADPETLEHASDEVKEALRKDLEAVVRRAREILAAIM
ncbi:hypothetical protein ACQEU8_02425 [Streptomyces sp. CA-250714]|uniref:hypothetical protein n=1 Tax=Streptomyces sp. CA-250714 TaxID=3240060 RepID=UPI003D8D32BB